MSTTGEYERFFPYEEPYPNQRSAMAEIAGALDDERDVLLEGAPGTGKTLSALVPALEYARRTDKTVVITTNVHQQMRQFVEDARAITREEPLRAVVFKGKASMCHIDVEYQECQTLRDTTRTLVEKEDERAELTEQAEALLDRIREGADGAAEARSAVTDELDDIEDELEELREGNVCEHYYNNLERSNDEFFEWLFSDVRTPEEIYEYAHERQLCGYELLKEGMEAVDLVVCNYHHLLDPNIREQFFRWLGRDPEEVVTVFDEAHNIESAARDHASRTLTENTLEEALGELEDADDSRAEPAENVLSAFLGALRETYDDAFGFGEREQVGEEWYDLSIANTDRRDELTLAFLDRYEGRGIDAEVDLALQLGRALDQAYEEAYREGEATTRSECQTLQAAEFVATWMADGGELGQHPMCSVRRDAGTDEIYGRAELYTCIPREVTEGLFEDVHASILMSATLRPFDVVEDVLGLSDPATMAYGLEYPEERRRTLAVGAPALFSSERNDPETQSVVADVLADAMRFTPGNALFFFPSYSEAERYHDRLRSRVDVDGAVLRDGPDVDTESLRRRFVDDDGAALFTSLWGTLAEGVSFDGDDARTVAVVGVPYPHLSERMEAVQEAYERAYEDRNGAGWRYAVEIPTIRKTRQALGRVIRSPEDFGVRLLVDKRYTQASADMGKYGVRESFPREESAELVDVAPDKLKFAMLNFYGDLDAYEGEPPQP
ncbi:ATP-dependent DNA helicase [Halobellus clavatus]|uniref:DNA excision repair protein ERCC-2 n=1 Tax=Halobellus clavatus TaxID=660517 RepID=A0A1H3EJ09_9EURY|nr:ATP-dependent DNA helicase [Halobellus clavatus]SDX77904.1 DNA excision repair protein ERCC-2 [Halobellus clavatus]